MTTPTASPLFAPATRRLPSHRFLIARRISQLSILVLFLLGPLFGIWIIEGNLNSSLLVKTVPMSDPFLVLQTLFTGHIPALTAITGAIIIAASYFLLGGRVYCAWVCPLNLITDLAYWTRRKLKLRNGWSPNSNLRFWILPLVLLVTLLSGTLVWEHVNPVSMTHRGIISGMGIAWVIGLMVFVFDLLIAPRGWCGHLCPTGAFYAIVGRFSPLKISTRDRAHCDECGDCYRICPEPQVIKPALQGPKPLIASSVCNNCGRCIDSCPKGVFHYSINTQNIKDSL